MGVSQSPGRDHLNMPEAFAAYEAVRHRLPAVQRAGSVQRLPDLGGLADSIDTFLLDAFGVLNIGETAIAGVPERVAGLQKAGKRVIVVSNAAGYPHSTLMEKYKRLGYDFAPEDVITSRKTVLHALSSEPKRRWGVVAQKSFGLEGLDHLDMAFLGDHAADYDDVEGFLMLGSSNWTDDRQTLLEASLARNPRPVFVGNPDIVAPREYGFSTEPGHYAHRLADRTGIEPQFFGKPFNNIFELAFAQLGPIDPARTVMVGDSLHTDILGGQIAGIKSALIAGFGFFDGHDVHKPISTSGIIPDYILDRP